MMTSNIKNLHNMQFTAYLKLICASVFIVALWSLNIFGFYGNIICYLLLISFSLYSVEWSFKVLLVSALVVNGNPDIIHLYLPVGIGRYILMFVCACRLIIHYATHHKVNNIKLPYIRYLVLFAVWIVISLFINNYFPIVSFLKMSVFLIGFYILVIAPSNLTLKSEIVVDWIFTCTMVFVIGSIIFYFLGMGFFKSQDVMYKYGLTLFRGVFNQPQSFGIACSFAYLFLLNMWLFTNSEYRTIIPPIAVLLIFLIYLTDSRTALFSVCIMTFVFVATIVKARQRQPIIIKNRIRMIICLVLLVPLCISIYYITDAKVVITDVQKFLSKNRGSEITFEEFVSGRNRIAGFSYQNFRENPITGIGFGISYDSSFSANASWFAAPTEKSFLPTAVLEETGFPGALLFLCFIVSLLLYAIRERNYSFLLMMCLMLLVNFGEMMFFSFGGVGLMAWCYVCGGLLIGKSHIYSINPYLSLEHRRKRS